MSFPSRSRAGLNFLLVLSLLLNSLIPLTIHAAPIQTVTMNGTEGIKPVTPVSKVWLASPWYKTARFEPARGVLSSGEDVVITSDTTWYSDTVTLGNLSITNNAALTLAGASGTLLTVEGLLITDSAQLLISGTASITASGSLTLAEGAAIAADGLGYGSDSGPGAPSAVNPYSGPGAGHGGYGGDSEDAQGGAPYGQLYTPQTLGSGGGSGYNGTTAGGDGGGAIRLIVSDTLILDGVLSANGTAGEDYSVGYGGGGGAGGSIWVTTGVLTGSGSIQANGGQGGDGYRTRDGGGGAGGRVAIYAGEDHFSQGEDCLQAQGGASGGAVATPGGPGTIYVHNSAGGELRADNADQAGPAAALPEGQYVFDSIELTGQGHVTLLGSNSVLTLTNDTLDDGDGSARLEGLGTIVAPAEFVIQGATVAVGGQLSGPENITTTSGGGLALYAVTALHSGPYTYANLYVGAGTSVSAGSYITDNAVYTDDYGVELYVSNLTVETGGKLSADGLGYGAGSGPGAPEVSDPNAGPGAGHGGYGGDSAYGQGGAPYGQEQSPQTLGSGGDDSRYGTSGGAGGGAVRLVVSDTFTLDGVLSANGAAGEDYNVGYGGGGGSGGSIWVTTGVLTGSGSIQADGGRGGDGYSTRDGGGGAGGRVAVYATSDVFSATGGTISVAGGTGYEAGDAGTIVISSTAGSTLAADFHGTPTSGSAPLTVTFSNLCTGATGYQWDFGDGVTSTLENPTHVYTQTGSFTVALTATAGSESDVEVKTDYISVTALLTVTANFTATPLGGELPLTVTFSNLSTSSGTIDAYAWDFGDGSTSALANPTHTYTQTGVFTVILTATAGSESDTEVKTDYISATVRPVTVTANFAAAPTSGDAPLAVIFSNLSSSSDPIEAYAWDFGDGSTLLTTGGSTSAVENPVHVYTQTGSFTVTLTASVGDEYDVAVKGACITTTELTPVVVQAPSVNILNPAEGSVVGPGQVQVTGVVSDDGTLVGVWVNEVTATLVGQGFSATIVLSSGNQVIGVAAQDDQGALGFAERVLSVDGDGPLVSINSPHDGLAVYTLTPTALISYTDFYTGVNTSTFSATLTGGEGTGVNVSANFTTTGVGASGWLSLVEDSVYTLSVSIADALGNVGSASSTFYAPPGAGSITPPAVAEDSGWVSGVVYDSSTCDVHLTTCQGLAGAQATLSRAGGLTDTLAGTALTGPGGFFAFPVSETDDYWLRVEKDGYTYAQRQVSIVKERSAATNALYLTPVDTATTVISYPLTQTVVHTSSDGALVLQFPPGALAAGQVVTVTATNFEQVEFLPSGDLPPGTWETYAFNLGGDSEVSFLQPISVSLSNTLGFSPSTPIPLGYWNQATQEWEHAGTGVVDASGAWVALTVTHFSNYDCNDPNGPSGGEGWGEPGGGGGPPPQCSAGGEDGCFINYSSGDVQEWIDLPSVSVLGRSVAPQMRYSTRRANPSAVIDVRLNLDVLGDIDGEHIGWELYIEGHKTDSFTFAADLSSSGEVGRYRYFWDGRNALGERLPPGVYEYKVRFTIPYTSQYCYALDGVFGNPPDCENGATGVYVEAVEEVWVYGTVTLSGEPDSPWGSGWLLDDQERLYESENGNVLVSDGRNDVEFYLPGKDRIISQGPGASMLAWVNENAETLQTLPEGLARNWPGVTLDVAGTPLGVAVSADGKRAYVASDDGDVLSVLDLEATPPQVVDWAELSGASDINDVALSPDGEYAYVVSDPFIGSGYVSVVELETLTVLSSITVGSKPLGIAVSSDGARAYVTNSGDDTVSVLDLATETVTDTIAVGDNPLGVALSPDGTRAYVANKNDDTLSVLDTENLTLTNSISVGDAPWGVAVSADGEWAYVANGADDTLSVLDTESLTVTDSINVGDNPRNVALSSDGEWAFVVNQYDASVSLVDLTSGQQVSTIGVGRYPEDVALSPDGKYACVTNQSDDTVSVLDLEAQAQMNSADVERDPYGVAISPDGQYAYVTNYSDDNVSVIDLATQQQLASVELGSYARPRGIALSPGGDLAYVANYNRDKLALVDLAGLTLTDTIDVGDGPRGVAVSADGAYAYVTNYNDESVSVVNLTTTQELTAVVVGDTPHSIALSPNGEYAYVTNRGDDTLSVLDLGTWAETATIAVGNAPQGLALSLDGAWAYVVNYYDDSVSVVDLELEETVATIAVGDGPESIVLSPDGEYAYVTHSYDDDRIVVLDLSARQQVHSIGVGDKPLGIALWGAPAQGAASRTAGDYSTLSYDPARGAYSRTYPDGRQVYFNPDGTHDYTLEPDGLRTAYTYSDGALASLSVTAPGEATPRWTWTFEYDVGQVGNLSYSFISDPAGRTISLTLDDNGHLAQVVLPDGAGRSFFYDERGLMTQQVDGEGHVSDYVYDVYGRIREHAAPQRMVYDPATGQTTAQRERKTFTPSETGYALINGSPVGDPDDPAPAVLTSTLLVDGVTYERGGVSGHTNKWGKWLTRTDALSRTTTFERDEANRLTKLTQPNGDCVEIAYDEVGNPVSTARMGAAQCVLPPEQRDDDQIQMTVATYEPRFGKVKTTVDPLGRVTTYYYDYELGQGEAGKLMRVEYPMVRDENGVFVTPVVSYTYNAWGQLETTTDKRGTVTRYVYTQGTPDEAAGGASPLFAPGVMPMPGLRTQVVQDDGGFSLTTTYKDFDAAGNALTIVAPGDQNVTRYVYDVLGRIISQTSPIGVVTLSEYDGNGHLVRQVVDAGGPSTGSGQAHEVVTEYEYDAEGRLSSSQTTADGQTLQTGQVYDVNGKLAARQDARGNQTLSVYDDADQLTQSVDPTGQVISYTYDLNGRLESTTNAAGAVARTEYDALGRVSRSVSNWDDGVFDPSEPDKDNETRYQYDAGGNTIIVTDTLGRMRRTFYDNVGRTSGSIVNWDGSVTLAECVTLPPMRDENVCTLYAYDVAGNTVIVTDTVGRMTHTFYDALGRVRATVSNWNPVTLSSPDDCVLSPANDSVENVCTLYGYDAASNRITTTNALNQTSLSVYDEINRPIISVANWDGSTSIDDAADCAFPSTQPDTNLCTVTEYDARGQRGATQDPLGNRTEFGYDGQGRLITTTRYLDDEPVVTLNHYDALGNRVGQSDALGHTITYVYDEFNRLAATLSAEGVAIVHGYDDLGRVVTTTDGLGHQVLSGYDILGRRVAVTDAESNVTRYAYDTLGNQVAITDANGVRTSYLYDDLNRLSAVIENDTGGASTHDSNVLTQYVYDALGNRIVITNALGYTNAQTTYDVLGRPVVVEDALSHETRTRYNALGHRTVVTDANDAVTHYSYDGLNRLIGMHYVSDNVTVTYRYDAASNRTVMTDTLGTTLYVYDDLGRLVSVSDPLTGTVGYGYDLVGNRTQLIYPDGKVVTYTYNADNRLVQVEDWSNNLTGYEYDVSGRLITTTLPNGVVTTYQYNAANQLIDLAHAAADDTLLSSYSYALDGTGNRVQAVETLTETTRTITYTYDHLYRLTKADYSTGENFQYTYDAVGNMTAATTTITNTVVVTKAYDAANRLITVTTDGAARTLEWSEAGELLRDGNDVYQWSTAGRLVSATVDGTTSRYAYLGDGGRISMTVDGETTTYTLDLAAPLVQVLVARESASQRVSEYLYGVARIGEYDGAWRYHLADHLGSVRLLVGADGGVEGIRSYRPYGAPLSVDGTASSIYGFTGEQTDLTGLIYLRARVYSPAQSQFLTRDPWHGNDQQPLSLNPYLYVFSNPVNATDPSGKSPLCPRELPLCLSKTFRFYSLPVYEQDLDRVQWFGDTVFASNNRNMYAYSQGLHAGFDLGAPDGSRVMAGIYGTVVYVERGASVFSPNYIIIRPKSSQNELNCVERVVLYGHLGTPSVNIGDDVKPYTQIGTTEATETHVHFEIRDYQDDYTNFSSNKWFYNPTNYMGLFSMRTLKAMAKTQFDNQDNWTLVRFTGETDSQGNPILGDPYMQPIRIPR